MFDSFESVFKIWHILQIKKKNSFRRSINVQGKKLGILEYYFQDL